MADDEQQRTSRLTPDEKAERACIRKFYRDLDRAIAEHERPKEHGHVR